MGGGAAASCRAVLGVGRPAGAVEAGLEGPSDAVGVEQGGGLGGDLRGASARLSGDTEVLSHGSLAPLPGTGMIPGWELALLEAGVVLGSGPWLVPREGVSSRCRSAPCGLCIAACKLLGTCFSLHGENGASSAFTSALRRRAFSAAMLPAAGSSAQRRAERAGDIWTKLRDGELYTISSQRIDLFCLFCRFWALERAALRAAGLKQNVCFSFELCAPAAAGALAGVQSAEDIVTIPKIYSGF